MSYNENTVLDGASSEVVTDDWKLFQEMILTIEEAALEPVNCEQEQEYEEPLTVPSFVDLTPAKRKRINAETYANIERALLDKRMFRPR